MANFSLSQRNVNTPTPGAKGFLGTFKANHPGIVKTGGSSKNNTTSAVKSPKPLKKPASLTEAGVPLGAIDPSVDVPDDILARREAEVADILATPGPEQEEYDRLYKQMTGVVESQLRGELPDDVIALIEQTAAEKGLSYGLGAGSPASRALTLRDIGKTSYEVQQSALASGEMLTKLAESRREFNISTALASKELLENTRRTDLSATELVESSRQFNAQVQLNVSELLLKTMQSYHSMALSLAGAPEATASLIQEGADLQADFASLQDMIDSFKL